MHRALANLASRQDVMPESPLPRSPFPDEGKSALHPLERLVRRCCARQRTRRRPCAARLAKPLVPFPTSLRLFALSLFPLARLFPVRVREAWRMKGV